MKNGNTTESTFSNEDRLTFSTEELKLSQTAFFVERFFNGLSPDEIAEKYGTKRAAVYQGYHKAKGQIESLLDQIDRRHTGLKAARSSKKKFNRDEQAFLLYQVFGFTMQEVGEMLGLHRRTAEVKVKRLVETYRKAFETVNAAGETDAENDERRDKYGRFQKLTV